MFEYPNLNIQSKNILYKRLFSGKNEDIKVGKKLLLDGLNNFNELWRDNKKMSEPEKEKWVRDCSSTKLSIILKKIDVLLLKPLDKYLPNILHGGISSEFKKYTGTIHKRGTQTAAVSIIDGRRKRWFLGMDLQRFFEQVSQEKVKKLFKNLGCGERVAYMLSEFCCVELGSKNYSYGNNKVLARGFAPSVRLAIWCNIKFFIALEKIVKKEFKGKFPKIAVFIDDIGITAVKVDQNQIKKLEAKISILAQEFGVIINNDKTRILSPDLPKEFVGQKIGNNKIFIKDCLKRKIQKKKKQIQMENEFGKKQKLAASLKGLNCFRKYTKKISLSSKTLTN